MGLREFANRLLAAVSLPVIPVPKAPKKQQTLPGYRTQIAASTSAIRRDDRQLANTDLLSFRTASTTNAVVRNLVASSPDMSTAVSTYLRVGIPEDFTVITRNMDGSINPEGTALAHQILRRFTYVPDYALGFSVQSSLQSISESLGKELLQYGALAGEVVLDKSRLPMQLAPVTTTNLKFYEEDAGVRPVQDIGGVEIDLDIPTFIYVSIDQDLLNAYSTSYFESAIQPILADAEFTNDLRRVLKRAVHPRIVAEIIEEKIQKTVAPDILQDSEKYSTFLNTLIAGVESVINGLAPEDALVGFDSINYKYMEGTPSDLAGTFKAVQDLLNAKLATGSKTMPAILGHTTTSNAASAETMLYLKHADLVRRKLNEFWSRALTISVRLFGEDVYVDFRFAKLDLRPDGELEAFKAMEQSRILEQLSLGLLPDAEACVLLTGQLPPAGMAPLSGTMFKSSNQQIENPQSGTSVMKKTLEPGTPKSPKSPAKAASRALP
jgi:hypothetical protein